VGATLLVGKARQSDLFEVPEKNAERREVPRRNQNHERLGEDPRTHRERESRVGEGKGQTNASKAEDGKSSR